MAVFSLEPDEFFLAARSSQLRSLHALLISNITSPSFLLLQRLYRSAEAVSANVLESSFSAAFRSPACSSRVSGAQEQRRDGAFCGSISCACMAVGSCALGFAGPAFGTSDAAAQIAREEEALRFDREFDKAMELLRNLHMQDDPFKALKAVLDTPGVDLNSTEGKSVRRLLHHLSPLSSCPLIMLFAASCGAASRKKSRCLK